MTVSTPHPQDDFIPTVLRVLAPYLVLALSVFAAYSNIFENTFVFDDAALIQNNIYLRGWDHIGDILIRSTNSGAHIPGGFYRPLQILLYLILSHLSDGSTFLFHLLNLSLHMANTCFVYRLGTKLGFKLWGVFLAALVWGLHPLHTEAVTYMSATADPLFAFFCLWAIIILLPDISPHKILKITPLFLLSLLSKEAAVIFPLLVMAGLYFTNQQRLNIRTYCRTWPLWSISVIYMIWRLHAEGFSDPQHTVDFNAVHNYSSLQMYADSPTYRIYTFLATLPAYLQLLVWPEGLHMERAFPLYATAWCAPVVAGLVIVLLALGQIVQSGQKPNRGIGLSWGLLWFAAAYTPDSGILIPVNALFLEHWMYLPSIGLFLGLAEMIAKLLQNHPRPFVFFCSAVALAFAGMLSTKTYAQNAIWHDPVSFYGNIFKYGERSERAHNNLAIYYLGQADYTNAIEQLKQALAISNTYPRTWHNMGVVYLRMTDNGGHVQEAIQSLNRAIEIDPKFYPSYMLLADIYDVLDDKDKAKYYHDRADAVLVQHQ